jgi:hypothetical protein
MYRTANKYIHKYRTFFITAVEVPKGFRFIYPGDIGSGKALF